MKRKINFFVMPLWLCFMLVLTSCEQNWPELTTTTPIVIEGGIWNKDGYNLVSTAEVKKDTIFLYKGVQNTFAIADSKGKIVDADYLFGDGTAIGGNTVTHAYASAGIYQLKVIFTASGLTSMSGPVKVLAIGVVIPPEITLDECVISLYHAITADGKSQDTIGINIAYVEKALSPGKWFMSGDYNAWPTPANALAITKTRVINGKTYLIWGSIGQIGLEKCNGGKYLTDGSSSWFYAPKSIYWHVNANGGGEFWVYRKVAGISNNP